MTQNILLENDISSMHQMKKLSKIVAESLKPGDFLLLKGDFGVGKTTISKEIIKILTSQRASSPSFQMMKEYYGNNIKVIHWDLYSLKSLEDLIEKGFDPYQENVIQIIEWPEKIIEYIKSYYLMEVIWEEDDFRKAKLTKTTN